MLPGWLFAAAGPTFPSADRTVFNVRSFGAAGDGKTLDSPAINKTIQAASEAGGGTVLVPAGTYLCGSIHLTNNLNLILDAGAVILGAPQSMNAYDLTEEWHGQAYQDGGHTYFHNSLIWGENLTNVSITGTGMINGGGLVRSDGVRLDNIRIEFKGGGTKEQAVRVAPELGTGYPEPGNLGTMPAYGVFARHVRDLELANIRLSFDKEDLRPAMMCSDVHGLGVNDFKAQLAPNVPAARFKDVTGIAIRNSPVLDRMMDRTK